MVAGWDGTLVSLVRVKVLVIIIGRQPLSREKPSDRALAADLYRRSPTQAMGFAASALLRSLLGNSFDMARQEVDDRSVWPRVCCHDFIDANRSLL